MMDSVESERLDGEMNVIRLETPTDEQQNNADVVSLEEVDLSSTTQAADPIDRKGKLMAWYHSHSSTLGIIWLGLAFCIMFTAFSITQFYITELKKEIGFYSLFVVYLVFAFSNFIAPTITEKINSRYAIFLGAIPYTLYVLTSCFKSSVLLIITSVFVGVGAALLWCGHGKYLIESSKPSELGYNTGLFFSILQFNIPLGSAITGLLLQIGVSIFWTFLIMFIIAVIGTAMMVPVGSRKNIKLRDTTFTQDMKNTGMIFMDRRSLLMAPVFLHWGITLSVYFGSLPPIVALKNRKLISWTLVLFGVAEIVGSIVFGRLIDRFGRRVIMIVTFVLHVASTTLIWFMDWEKVPLFFITMFVCGLADSGYCTCTYSILGAPSYFKDQSSEAISASKFYQSISMGLTFLIANFSRFLVIKIILTAALVLALVCYIVLEFYIAPVDRIIHTEEQNEENDAKNGEIPDTETEVIHE